MAKKVSLASAFSDIKGLPARLSGNYKAQFETMGSAKKIGDHVILLDVKHDYALDEMLEEGCGNVGAMLDFARRRMMFGAELKLGRQELGCAAFTAVNEKGEYIMGRNFDYKNAPTMVVRTRPANGYASISVVDCNFMLYGASFLPTTRARGLQTLLAPYCCVDGINEKGLSIAVLELKVTPTYQDTGKKPISTTIAIRSVLDHAATVDEAVALFEQYDMHDAFGVAYHFAISDASGKAVLVEYVDNKMILLPPVKRSENGAATLAVTNHYVCPAGPRPSRGAGYDRLKTINDRLAEKDGVLTSPEAMQLLSDVHLEYYHKLGWPVRTLWSAVYNNSDASVDLCAGMDYETVYSFKVVGDSQFD